MQTPITITIESARFLETKIGIVRNALLFLLLPTMDCGERERIQKKGRAKIARPFWGWLFFDAVFCAFEGCL